MCRLVNGDHRIAAAGRSVATTVSKRSVMACGMAMPVKIRILRELIVSM
jgi:hypothetical protein